MNMNDRPTQTAVRTVRVRIAIAIDHTGAWAASGLSGRDDQSLRDGVYIDDLREGEVYHWIEADVPVPVREASELIRGDVTSG